VELADEIIQVRISLGHFIKNKNENWEIFTLLTRKDS